MEALGSGSGIVRGPVGARVASGSGPQLLTMAAPLRAHQSADSSRPGRNIILQTAQHSFQPPTSNVVEMVGDLGKKLEEMVAFG